MRRSEESCEATAVKNPMSAVKCAAVRCVIALHVAQLGKNRGQTQKCPVEEVEEGRKLKRLGE